MITYARIFPERRACAVVGQSRATQRRTPKVRDDEAALTDGIVRLAQQYGRYGYRRIREMLVAEGWRASASSASIASGAGKG